MRKMAIALAALVLCVFTVCGMAEGIGPGKAVLWAQEQGAFVDMHSRADEGSAILMSYYNGTVCDVREIDGDWARVRVGSETIYLQGYVKTENLCGVEVQRERGWNDGYVEFFESDVPYVVYAACDEHARVLERVEEFLGSVTVCGTNGEWAQLSDRNASVGGPGVSVNAGFIKLNGMQVMPGSNNNPVYPTADDMTFEEAYERAIVHMIENADYLTRFDEDERTEEVLRSLAFNIILNYDRETGEAKWWVYLEDRENLDRNAYVDMDEDGKLIKLAAGNG